MSEIRRFEDLVGWQLASELSDLVDDMTAKAPAQIAEAFARWSPADTANMLRIARASLAETQSHLLKGNRRRHWAADVFDRAWQLSDRTLRTTTGYMKER